MTVARWLAAFSGGILAVATPSTGAAQATPWELLGIVREIGGRVIEGATVEIHGRSARTDSLGLFRIRAYRRDSLTITVRRIVNERSGWCEGCLRTIDEIVQWSSLDDAAKRRVWRLLEQRREVVDGPAG